MGQHLQLHASQSISVEQAQEWCKYRARDLVEMPNSTAQVVENEMRNSQFMDHYEHGSKQAVITFDFLVWEARKIDAGFIIRVCDTIKNCENDPSLHMLDWLCCHYGWTVWGDNDGI